MFGSKVCEAVKEALSDLDVRQVSDDDLLHTTVAVVELRSLLEATEARLLAELGTRGTTDVVHGMRTTAWVASVTGCARGPLNGRLRVGRALRNHFDAVDTAVCDGRLTFDHAKALTDVANPRITDILTAAQDQIIDLAAGSTFAQWKRDVTALAEHADADGPEPDPRDANELRLPKTLDGRTELTGSLDAASGLIVRTAIDAKADELFRRYTHDAKLTPDLQVPTRKQLRAEALVELIRIAHSAEPGSGAAPRAEVTLLLHNHTVTDPDGTPIPRAAADVWGCDPDLWAVIVNQMGIPVDVGHTHRLATIAQRRAIAIRDGGCTFPGCDAPIDWCDHHHVTDWQHGGPTNLNNLVALCRHHHGITHRTGWTMTLDHNQTPHWTTPTGDHLTGQRHHARCSAGHPPEHRSPDKPTPGERTAFQSSCVPPATSPPPRNATPGEDPDSEPGDMQGPDSPGRTVEMTDRCDRTPRAARGRPSRPPDQPPERRQSERRIVDQHDPARTARLVP